MTRFPHPNGDFWLCVSCATLLAEGNVCEHCHTVLCDDCAALPHMGNDAYGNALACPASPKLTDVEAFAAA